MAEGGHPLVGPTGPDDPTDGGDVGEGRPSSNRYAEGPPSDGGDLKVYGWVLIVSAMGLASADVKAGSPNLIVMALAIAGLFWGIKLVGRGKDLKARANLSAKRNSGDAVWRRQCQVCGELDMSRKVRKTDGSDANWQCKACGSELYQLALAK